ncbi:MAG: bifunctional hydroxymethylpyrimidine kinase/phosphomethylpyrimidine kinase [Prevotellaceae bacterium]|nr:bifunctional hydroxymethylpyrimidine kinase/phosphomethylpyrimidine kinase [Prevotellaceae bacterium]
MKTILTIAASDSSAGAGIQQDIKTVSSLGHYAVCAITALTAQNTCGVRQVMEVPVGFFRAQLEALLADIPIDAVKIGVLPNPALVEATATFIERVQVPVVLDPVLASTSGWQFLGEACVAYMKECLLPRCTLVTPNIPEAMRLLDGGASDGVLPADIGPRLVDRFHTAFLVKGGHAEGAESVDRLYLPDHTVHAFASPRIATGNLHGTGCTLSTAVATFLATGLSLPESVRRAKEITLNGILRGRALQIGKGHGPLWMFPDGEGVGNGL